MRNLNDFAELTSGYSENYLAKYLQVNPKTIRRWKTGTTNAPHAIRLLLRIKLEGDLSAIGGKEWEGFTINAKFNTMCIPFFHRPFEPRQIIAMFFTTQDAWTDKRDLKQLRVELRKLKEKLNVHPKMDSSSNNHFWLCNI